MLQLSKKYCTFVAIDILLCEVVNLLQICGRHFFACYVPIGGSHTPVGSINVPPTSQKCQSTGQVGTVFFPSYFKTLSFMCEQQNNVPVGVTSSTKQVVEHPWYKDKQTLKRYYLEQVRLLCPTVSPESSEALRLWALLRKTKRIINMLTYFDRPWEDGMPEIQKACLTFLITDNIPKKERLQTIEKWGNWTEFLVGASRYRSFITQVLQYYHRQLHDLERLVGCEPSESPNLITD